MTHPKSFDPLLVKKKANGMLSIDVYNEMYLEAQKTEQGTTILEIGTAHGAGTISLALGMHKKNRVVSIDKLFCMPNKFGNLEENKAIIKKNFKFFDVEKVIDFYNGTSTEVALRLPKEMTFGMLVIDTDGAIDRDFELFYNRLIPGSSVIIDDYSETVRIRYEKKNTRVDQKFRLTHMLISFMEQKKLLEKIKVIDNTYFGIKPTNQNKDIDFSKYDFRQIYRRLTSATAQSPNLISRIKLKVIEYISQITLKLSPNLYQGCRKIYKKLKVKNNLLH